ncbi:TonB-dependent receptor [Hyunsoonleella sp. SJ7]|uniref:TonB-dependent receptor n=1 Tax=Hyunsoonleella aquatilis TaxID=2762758 RepID=A0A923H7Y9_9FLAO|nr:TonB-dependent receptor [Hyunsoonleella aquatilis]
MNPLLRVLLIHVFLCLSYGTFAQVEGKVVDASDSTPLKDVKITFIKTGTSVLTDSEGRFKIAETGIYLIGKQGYNSLQFTLIHNSLTIIKLSKYLSLLNEVIVNAHQIPTAFMESTNAIHLISPKDIEQSNHTDFAPILNRTPGVFMQNGALNTNRITVRGVGSRTPFGTSKIRAYFNDIPLTNGSGETTIEDFELASLSKIEITKGATSSSYGAGLGGVIHLKSDTSYLNESQINPELQIGSFGLQKGILNVDLITKTNSFKAVYSNTASDGFRENNNYNRQTLTLSTNHQLNANNKLMVFGSYVSLKAFIPSSLNQNDFENQPHKAAFTWKSAKGFEDAKRGVFGLTWKHNLSSKLRYITSVFTSFREAFEPRPFNILEENTVAFGFRTRLMGDANLGIKPFSWTIGGEYFKDNYSHKTFDNLYQDFPPETGSVQGDKLSDFKENRGYFNAFAEANIDLTQHLIVSMGLNLNRTGYDLEDRFPVSNDNPDQSGNFNFNTILSPTLGISQRVSKNVSVFSNIGHGFSPLSLDETLLPDGQINTNLKPETGWNFEVGTRGEIFNHRLQFNLSAYRMNIKNLLVARRTAEDQFIGINAGKTQHDGLEATLNYKLLQHPKYRINLFTSYSLNRYVFKTFVDDDKNFSGNDLTGVPKHVFNAVIEASTDWGFYGNINYIGVGKMPITDSNNLYSEGYGLVNLKIGWAKTLNKSLKINVFSGINNIFDIPYASQILINAPSFGNNLPRYYYPGNPVNHFSGINFSYIF